MIRQCMICNEFKDTILSHCILGGKILVLCVDCRQKIHDYIISLPEFEMFNNSRVEITMALQGNDVEKAKKLVNEHLKAEIEIFRPLIDKWVEENKSKEDE